VLSTFISYSLLAMNFKIERTTNTRNSKYVNYVCPMFSMMVWKAIDGTPIRKELEVLTCFKNDVHPIAVHLTRTDAARALRKFKQEKKNSNI
jgi:hypothetical protein